MGLQQLTGSIDDRQIPPLVSDAGDDAGLTDPLGDSLGRSFVQPERLLDEEADAAVDGGQLGLPVAVRRYTDEDRIEAGLLEHGSVVRIRAGAGRLGQPACRLQTA